MPEGLTPRQKAFIEEFHLDHNAIQAAIRAGYDPETAGEQVRIMMMEPSITGALHREKAHRTARAALQADAVLHEMSLLSHSNIAHYVIDDTGNVQLAAGAPEGAMRAIQSIKRKVSSRVDKEGNATKTYDVEIKLWDKPTPLKLMGKQVGLFPDKVEHSGPGGKPIESVTRIERVIVDGPSTAPEPLDGKDSQSHDAPHSS